jgi:hypothetical protein
LAIISGKNLIMDEQKQNQLFIFKKKLNALPKDPEKFTLYKKIVVKDMPMFEKVCMQFFFKNQQPG